MTEAPQGEDSVISFSSDDLYLLNSFSCHNNLISSIEVIKDKDAFATSSFDCCVHIWCLKTFNKLGSLILA